jgi:hypothetical protein
MFRSFRKSLAGRRESRYGIANLLGGGDTTLPAKRSDTPTCVGAQGRALPGAGSIERQDGVGDTIAFVVCALGE